MPHVSWEKEIAEGRAKAACTVAIIK
jgi:hypothetical protein